MHLTCFPSGCAWFLVLVFGVGLCSVFSRTAYYATQRVWGRQNKLYLIALPFTRRLRELIFIKNQQNIKSYYHPKQTRKLLSACQEGLLLCGSVTGQSLLRSSVVCKIIYCFQMGGKSSMQSREEALKLQRVVVGEEGWGEIPWNRIWIISLHIFTTIRISLCSVVSYDPVFVLCSDQETTNLCLKNNKNKNKA